MRDGGGRGLENVFWGEFYFLSSPFFGPFSIYQITAFPSQ
jgi:hypothetical protein